jgi:hypothetical protein
MNMHTQRYTNDTHMVYMYLMCVCIHTCTCEGSPMCRLYVYIYIYIYIYTHTHINIHTYIHKRIYVKTHVVHVCTKVCIGYKQRHSLCVCVCMYTHTHSCTVHHVPFNARDFAEQHEPIYVYIAPVCVRVCLHAHMMYVSVHIYAHSRGQTHRLSSDVTSSEGSDLTEYEPSMHISHMSLACTYLM